MSEDVNPINEKYRNMGFQNVKFLFSNLVVMKNRKKNMELKVHSTYVRWFFILMLTLASRMTNDLRTGNLASFNQHELKLKKKVTVLITLDSITSPFFHTVNLCDLGAG